MSCWIGSANSTRICTRCFELTYVDSSMSRVYRELYHTQVCFHKAYTTPHTDGLENLLSMLQAVFMNPTPSKVICGVEEDS